MGARTSNHKNFVVVFSLLVAACCPNTATTSPQEATSSTPQEPTMAPSSSSVAIAAVAVVVVTTTLAATTWLAVHRRREQDEQDEQKAIATRTSTTTTGPTTSATTTNDSSRSSSSAPPIQEIHASSFPTVAHHDDAGGGGTALLSKLDHRILAPGTITVVHGSVTGTCSKLAYEVAKALEEAAAAAAAADNDTNTVEDKEHDASRNSLHPSRRIVVQVAPVADVDWWDELSNDEGDAVQSSSSPSSPAPSALLVVLLSTYTDGAWPPTADALSTALHELLTDWRIAKFPLKRKLQVAAFGTGSSEYDTTNTTTVGRPAQDALRLFQRLGASRVAPLAIGDDATGDHVRKAFETWQQNLLSHLHHNLLHHHHPPPPRRDGEGKDNGNCCGAKSNGAVETTCCQTSSTAGGGDVDPSQHKSGDDTCEIDQDNVDEGDDEYDYDDDESDDDREPEVMDLEDMGDSMLASSTMQNGSNGPAEPREMVTPSQAAALKKEGYKLIGTHSAVKLCRWTKHQLRGRGGCYKHTFYGITSYQCMEATPSLACANKCVFCWRHHKNPVGKEWRWKTDDPHYIVEQAVLTHVQMIKEARGIPGVQMDRWKEALTVRHCALSLVGEPIMYPRIDELLHDLHTRKISTFLVTNGQHPQSIGTLRPITQLYVSVDAPTKESLIAIDRPLFRDAWERLRLSLTSLKDKGQRTVARLTVVKGWNSDEVEGYARLIALGHVSLVEVKGVTFCGKSDASNLNMTNTPWHHEVVELTQTLKREIDKIRAEGGPDVPPEYDLACEHKHSCSVLLARVDQFAETDTATGARRWKTWIDYDTFHQLAARHASDPSFRFAVEDYTAETPSWALFGSDQEGFDPTDTRHRKSTKHPKYLQFDDSGIPTHDHNNQALGASERERLRQLMVERQRQIGTGSVVTEMRDGAKEVLDASLMFRGLVVAK